MDDASQDTSGYTVTSEAHRELRRWSQTMMEDLLLKARLLADQRASTTVTRKDIALAAQSILPDSSDEFIAIRRSTLRRILSLIALGVMGAATWLLGEVIPEGNSWLSAVAGLSAGGATAAVVHYIRSRTTGPRALRGSIDARAYAREEVLSAWLDIERALRDVSAEKSGTDTASRPVGALIEDFYASNEIDESFRRELSSLLEERNTIAHRGGFDLTSEEARSFVSRARWVQKQIADRLASAS